MKLAAGAFLVFLALPSYAPFGTAHGKQDDKVLQEAFRKYQEVFNRPRATEDEKIDAVRALAYHKDERVVKVLARSFTQPSVKVSMAVARELGGFANVSGAPEALVGALKTFECGGRRTNGIRILAIRSLGQLKVKDAAPEVDKLIVDKDSWVSKAAIDAAGQIRAKSSIEPLIRALRRIEGPDGNGELPANPLAEELPNTGIKSIINKSLVEQVRPKSERDVLTEPIQQSLKAITRVNCGGAKEWESWWSKSKSSFKVPD
jgi:hypothetical protein